jgi:tetratricopeptide (TPR) repeat protein
MLAGDPVSAEREFKTCLDELAEMGEQGIQSTVAAALAHALIRQGRLDEAEESVSASELAGAEDDVSTQVLGRSARARIQAGRGLYDEAKKLARDAVALSESTDDLNMRGDTLAYLGDVLSAAGERQDASAALESALELYGSKGNTVAAATARRRLTDLSRPRTVPETDVPQ